MKTENELMAEFMGLVRRERNGRYNLAQYYKPHPTHKQKKGSFVGYAENLKYSESWDCLMPVVLYAKKLPNSAEWNWEILNMYLCRCEISGVHKELVAFIKWYNSQNS